MSQEIPGWVRALKEQKEACFEDYVPGIQGSGDLHPTVVAERGGELLCLVMAPQINRDQGLQAANVIRMGTECDTLTLGFDAYTKQGKKGDDRRHRQGDFQRQFSEEGGHGIKECLLCIRVHQEGSEELWMLTYSTTGGKLRWDPLRADGEQPKPVGGYVFEALRQIMKRPWMGGAVEARQAKESLGLDYDRARFFSSRGAFKALAMMGFLVADFLSPRHPEYLGDDNPEEKPDRWVDRRL